MADSPGLVTGMRLLDAVKARGFTFRRVAPGPDGPLEGVREIGQWRDTQGSAHEVLTEVLAWPTSEC